MRDIIDLKASALRCILTQCHIRSCELTVSLTVLICWTPGNCSGTSVSRPELRDLDWSTYVSDNCDTFMFVNSILKIDSRRYFYVASRGTMTCVSWTPLFRQQRVCRSTRLPSLLSTRTHMSHGDPTRTSSTPPPPTIDDPVNAGGSIFCHEH